jgi:hypothetical protein
LQQPNLVFDRNGSAKEAKIGAGCNFYFDPRGGINSLCSIDLEAKGPVDLKQTNSLGCFCEPHLKSIAVHKSGYAIAINRENSRLEVLKLPMGPVNQCDAPRSEILSGQGTRKGLMDKPVDLAITPEGVILVLENGNTRIQAFDVFGNPVPYFPDSSPFLLLGNKAEIREYLDIAVSSFGLVYILSRINKGENASDYYLDIYESNGNHICETNGLCASSIEVDSWGRIYSLNFESIYGADGISRPSISQWEPL